MHNFTEIQQLNNLLTTHQIKFELTGGLSSYAPHLKPIKVLIKDNLYKFYVDDEHNDLSIDNPALWLCLVLLELEEYKEEDDYLTWCRSKGLDASNEQLLSYYKGLGNIYSSIEHILGTVRCPISSFEFELNAGAAQELRKR